MMAFIRPFLPHLMVAAAIIGFVLWIDARGYDRARRDNEALAAKVAADTAKRLRSSELRLAGIVAKGDTTLAGQIAAIDIDARTIIQPAITKELSSDPRYSDPDAGISVGLLDTLNRARARSTCAGRADGGITCTVRGYDGDTGAADR